MLSRNEREDLYRKAIDKWGVDFQILMLFEEIGELQQAVVKFARKNSAANRLKVMDEIADVEIMLEQTALILGATDEEIEKVKNAKLLRLKRMLDNRRGEE